jgi:hypothetical protein
MTHYKQFLAVNHLNGGDVVINAWHVTYIILVLMHCSIVKEKSERMDVKTDVFYLGVSW